MIEPPENLLVRDMGYTAVEFAGVLHSAFAEWNLASESANRWRIGAPGVEVLVAISTEAPRRLGALVLPVLRVSIEFLESDAAGRKRFLTRFERCFHKGGG